MRRWMEQKAVPDPEAATIRSVGPKPRKSEREVQVLRDQHHKDEDEHPKSNEQIHRDIHPPQGQEVARIPNDH